METMMSIHEALRLALSEIYATLDRESEEDSSTWITPPDALREAARVIDHHMREAQCQQHDHALALEDFDPITK